jgi:hypothetical protein
MSHINLSSLGTACVPAGIASTGLCGCGCGLPTVVSKYNDASHGYVAGIPRKFLKGHQPKVIGVCSVPGCDRPIHCKGLCDNHYRRSNRGTSLDTPIQSRYTCTPVERLLIKQKLVELVEAEQPTQCRHIAYKMLTATIDLSPHAKITKEEKTFQRINRYLADMRLAGLNHEGTDPSDSIATDPWIPFEWLTDNTREIHQVFTSPTLQDTLRMARIHNLPYWDNQPEQVEIWVEKDGLVGVLQPVMEEYRIDVVPVRGHCLGFLYTCFKKIRASDKKIHIGYLGDSDGYGEEIQENIERKAKLFGVRNITFERLAVMPWQIEKYNLPTRPPKGRAADKVDRAVEVDAIDSDMLRQLVRDFIEPHFNRTSLTELLERESNEQAWLNKFVAKGIKELDKLAAIKVEPR